MVKKFEVLLNKMSHAFNGNIYFYFFVLKKALLNGQLILWVKLTIKKIKTAWENQMDSFQKSTTTNKTNQSFLLSFL